MIDGDLKVGDRIRSTASRRVGVVRSVDLEKEYMDVVVEWDRALSNEPQTETHSSKGLKLWAERVEGNK